MKKFKYLLLLIPLLFISKVDAATYENVNAGLSSFKYNWCSFNLSVSSGPTSVSCNYISVPTGTFDSWTTDSSYNSRPRALAGFNFQTQGIDAERFYNGEDYTLIMSVKLQGVTDIGNIKYNLHGGSSYNTTSNNVNILSSNISKNDNNYYTVTINFSPTVTFQYLTVIANNELSNGLTYSNENTPIKYFIVSDINMSIGLDDYNITRYISDEKEIINQNNQTNEKLDDLKESQKENTEAQIESQKVCTKKELYYDDTDKSGYYLNNNGGLYASSNWGITDFLVIENATITLSNNFANNTGYTCFYSKTKDLIGCVPNLNQVLNIPDNSYYARFSIRNSNQPLILIEKCINGNQAMNDSINDLNDTLTDSSPTDMSGLEESIGWLPAGPVDSIINLPLRLFNSLFYNLSNKTCISAELELPFVEKNITLPCIKTLYNKIGITGTLFQSAGIIASGFILFNYLLALYHWVDKTLTLRENTMPGYYEDNWGGGA